MRDGRVWTASDVAEFFHMSRRWVLLRAHNGELPCVWVGDVPLFLSVDFDSFPIPRHQERLELEELFGPPADEQVAEPAHLAVPYQRADGRWSVRIKCPDGQERRFISRGREPLLAEHRRKGRRGSPSPRVRFVVLQRDGFACRYCGRRPPEVALELDHVISVADGGTDVVENLVAACSDCNLGKRGDSLDGKDIPA